ncbi:MAG: sugar phosphate isomerase/epimerase, partial [Phycisphaerae bacterium]|nr:sugar phosphate isomerase/epimerase [Phycisphaerae bacterium]
KTAVELKMDGIDWVTTYGRDPKELKKMSHDAGLAIACHTFLAGKLMAGDADWLDEIKQSLDDAVELGAPVVMIPTMFNDKISRDDFRQFWIDALKQIAPFADQAGVTLTIENFPRKDSAFVTAADFFEAKAQIPQLKLTYDNGNAASGEDPVESLNLCKDDIVHVHFKDWYVQDQPGEGCLEMLNGKYFKPALIGQGDMPTRQCWNALKLSGYDGYVNIEYEGDDIPADEATKLAMDFLRQSNF